MKILLPFQDPYNNPLTHPVVSGGTEMFCKAINDNFDTEVHQVPIESVNYSLKQKNQIAKAIEHIGMTFASTKTRRQAEKNWTNKTGTAKTRIDYIITNETPENYRITKWNTQQILNNTNGHRMINYWSYNL